MTQPLVLSASSVTTFLRCGRQWMYAYVEGIKSPPSLRAVRGIAVHKAVEVDMNQKMESGVDLPVADMHDAYDTSWTAETQDGWRADNDEKPDEVKDKGHELVELHRFGVAPNIQPSMVEEPIQFTINGQAYSGQIDLGEDVPMWDGSTRLRIRDTKTTGRTPTEGSYQFNMTGYAISQRQRTGQLEADTVLDYLIALKEPVYKPISAGGPITDEQIRSFAGVVGDVSSAIQAGRFVPNGVVNGACGWCGYKAQCPAYLTQNPYL